MKIIEKRENGSIRVHTKNVLPSKTDQQFRDEVNVNNIVAKYLKTGEISHQARQAGQYFDASQVPDLYTGLVKIHKAELAFKSMPDNIRARFKNGKELLEFLADPGNKDEAIKLGLVEGQPLPIKEEDNVDKGPGTPKENSNPGGNSKDS